MNLAKHYSKSIIKKFDYIPVYLPDTKIRPGAILSFGTGFFGGASDPLGSFDVIGNLINGETFNFPLKVGTYTSNASYNFVSQDEVTVSVVADAKLPNVVNGDIQFNFGKKGAILLYAVKPTESRIEDQLRLIGNLREVSERLKWGNYYIVTSVITCSKALVYQSKEKNGTLIVSASGKNIGIDDDVFANFGANVSFDVKWKTKQAMSIDWAEDVVLFMKLVRFTKKKLKSYEKAMSTTTPYKLDQELITTEVEEENVLYKKVDKEEQPHVQYDVLFDKEPKMYHRHSAERKIFDPYQLVEVDAKKLRKMK